MKKLSLLSVCLLSLISTATNAHLYNALQSKLQNEKYGMVDATGKEIIPFEYDKIWGQTGNLIVVKKSGKWGAIDIKGKEIIPFQFDRPPYFPENSAVGSVRVANQYALISLSGEPITAQRFDSSPKIAEGFIAAELDNKWGVLNQVGEWVVKPTYDEMSEFSEGIARVKMGDKYGFIDYAGNQMIKADLDSAGVFQNGRVYVTKNGEAFYLDRDGQRIKCNVPHFLPMVTCLDSGFAVFKANNVDGDINFGVVDPQGNIALSPIYQYISDEFEEGLALVVDMNERFGYINTKFDVVIKPQYLHASAFHNGLAVVYSEKEQKYGVINTENKAVVPFNYRFIHHFNHHLAVAAAFEEGQTLRHGVIDEQGNHVIPLEYADAESKVINGTLGVKKGQYWGVINLKNEAVVPFEYEALINSASDYLPVQKAGKWGFIDKQNNRVVPFDYEEVSVFAEGLAGVKKAGKWGFINAQNQVVLPFEYTAIGASGFSEGKIYVRKGDASGMINTKGEFVGENPPSIAPMK